jgi:hypothetical protein
VISLLVAAAVAAVVQPKVVAVVPPQHRLVEGVASDGTTIWASSVIDRQIVACAKGCKTIATLPGGLHPLGIAWDWTRKLLWIAADCPDLPDVPRCEKGALVAIDAAGKLRAVIAPKLDFHPGDVSVSQRGIFVSDSHNGLVYGLFPARRELRAINRPGDGRSAQGTALAPDGVSVIVADYSRGIGRIDLKTTATTWLPGADGKALSGVDGLVRCGESFVGVYNGSAPGRVLSVNVKPKSVDAKKLVSDARFADPTQIAFDGKRLLLVSDAGWEAAAKPNATRISGARIVALPLPDGCERS